MNVNNIIQHRKNSLTDGDGSMNTQTIKIDNGQVKGFLIELDHAPLILLKAKQGYVMCGYLNMAAANKMGDVAGRVTGVKSFEDVLHASVIEVSENAKKMGLIEGMNAEDFLNKLL